MLNIISLGAGVQSSTIALMAARGEITPMPDCAIFADTQSEPKAVYQWLDWLEQRLPFPVHRVTTGNLREEIMGAMNGRRNRMDARPPFFTRAGGMLNRQCTQDFKLRPIERKTGELIGHIPGSRWPTQVVVDRWIGISTDEAGRMKPSRDRYTRHRYPLIELDMSRGDCLAYFDSRGLPRPPKSACTFCPYHDDAYWRAMKADRPAEFADAVAVDEAIRRGMPGPKAPVGDAWYLHRSRKPLADVDFRTPEEAGQLSMFDEECAGVCGV